MSETLGIDIGGTSIRAALVAPDGVIRAAVRAATPFNGTADQLRRVLAQLIAQLQTGLNVTRVGVALPGIWNRRTGIMERAVNLPALEGVNLFEFLEAACGLAATVENDVVAAGFAQYQAAGRPARFAYLSIGTGVAACVILQGEILRHTRGGPGHFGHLMVDTAADAPACRCGGRGCLEAVAGGAAGVDYAEPRIAQGLAIGLLHLTNVYAPDCLFVGGGVIDHHPGLLPAAVRAFYNLGCRLPPGEMRIEPAPLRSDEAGVIGAALLARQSSGAGLSPT